MEKREEIKNKIITASIECIEKYGISGTTTRNISELAQVNVSAISYYFQGIDNLLNDVFDKTLENAFRIDDVPIDENDDYKTVLKKVLNDWLTGAYAYPNIARAHLNSAVNSTVQQSIIFEKMNSFFDILYQLLIKHGMPDDSSGLNKLQSVFSSLLGHIIFNGFKKNTTSDNLFIEFMLSGI